MRFSFVCLVLFFAGIFFGFITTTPTRLPPPVAPRPPSPPPLPTQIVTPPRLITKPQPQRPLSDVCLVLRPRVDPSQHGSLLIAPPPQSCVEYTWYPVDDYQGLGHRICNWLTGHAASLAWNLPMAVEHFDMEKCGNHGCYPGAVKSLGMNWPTLGNVTVERHRQKIELSNQRNWLTGEWLKHVIAIPPTRKGVCGSLYQFRQNLWLSDMTITRPLITSMVMKTVSADAAGSPALVSDSEKNLIVAIHLRYSTGGDGSKGTSTDWLRNLIQPIIDSSRRMHVPISWHVFSGSGSAPGFIPQPVQVHSKELDAPATFKRLAASDILICGHSSLCFLAALASTDRSVALLPSNKEPFAYNMCPGNLECVANSGSLTSEQVLRIEALMGSWLVANSLSCPSLWKTG